MKKFLAAILSVTMLCTACPFVFAENETEPYVEETTVSGISGYVSATDGIKIAGSDKTPVIYVDDADWAGVVRAVGDLKEDIESVTDVAAAIVNENADNADIVVGTIGKSAEIDMLIEEEKLDVAEIKDKWECFTIQNVDGTIVIAGSDKRGTIYGIYDLSEKIGVSPWSWWADTVPAHLDELYINLDENGYTEGEPSVQYRGIFLNDEYNLTTWSTSLDSSGNMNTETYKKIFELLLRLKANYCWPAMHTYSTAFNNTEHNAEIADEYGIVMGSSHCEPLLRNNLGELYNYQQEWIAAHPDKTLYINATDDAKHNVSWMWTDKDADGNAVDNKEFITDYLRERVRENGGYENTYTLGMRGVHDGKFDTNMDKQTAMKEILDTQRQILTEELCADGKEITDIPQIFIPYKEILDLYNGGLEVPDDVTLMWTDDNFGYIRQLPTETERQRSGGAGIYYHLSYRGRPTSYLWLSTTQLGLIREEMTKAYESGAQKIWIANVGDLKPAETQIEYFLDLARNVGTSRNKSIYSFLTENAKRDFGFNDTQAAEYAYIQNEFYKLANSRRPEHLVQGLFNLEDFGDEGQKYIDNYKALVERSEALYNTLDEARKPSFFELQLYPLRCCYNMAEVYVNTDRAKLYKEQGRGMSVNKYAKAAADAADRIDSDTAYYNSMLDGKWNNIMTYQPKGLVSSYGDWPNVRPETESVSEVDYAEMGVAAEGGTLTFDYYNQRAKFIDIYNKGLGTVDYKVTTDADWIKLNKTEDTVADDDRIYAMADYTKAPSGEHMAQITVTQYIGDTAVDTKTIDVQLTNNQIDNLNNSITYVEADGYVSIEAENASYGISSSPDYDWMIEENLGRSGYYCGCSVKSYPNTGSRVDTTDSENSAYLAYDVYFTSAGTFPIDVYRMPTLNELSGSTMRFSIGVDDGTPVQFSGNTKTTDNSNGTDAWGKGVLQNTEVLSGTITVPSAGLHTIRLYNGDCGVIIDKMVITTGEKKPSYYGAPESYNTGYNKIAETMPPATSAASSQTGTASALFDPSLMIADVETRDDSGIEIGDNSMTLTLKENLSESGRGIIAAYNSDGTLSGVAVSTNTVEPAETDEIKTFSFDKSLLGDYYEGFVWNSLEEMKPLTDKITQNISGISSVKTVKLKDIEEAVALAAAYNANGELIANSFADVDLSDTELNSAADIPLTLDIPEDAANIQIILFDSFDNLNPLAPIYKKTYDGVSLMASYENNIVTAKSNLNEYIGKQSMALITPYGTENISSDDIIYVGQEKVTDESYKSIPCTNLDGKYTLKIGISGGDKVFEEIFNTAKNIETDTEAKTTELYSWNFDTDQTGTGSNVPVLGGNAVYDSANQCIKMTSTASAGGSLTVDLDGAVTAAQGEKITVVSKIAYGNLTSKYMTYELTDSSGNMLIRSNINRYTGKTQSLTIGGVEQLTDGNYPSALQKIDNNATTPSGKFSIYTAVIDPASNEIKLTISNTANSTVNEYTGKLPDGTSYDLKKLYFTTDYNNAGRTCYVDDISIAKSKDASYTINFAAVDTEGNNITGAEITVTDGVTGAVISPESDGTYKLCDGLYSYTVTYGEACISDTLELSQATESKTITVPLQ